MIIARDILETFKKWKNSADRKPVLIKGARQIGKTWVMEEFGRQCYEHYVKFDFDEQQELASVFQTTKDPHRIIKELELFSDVPLLPEKTLIIFDEIQECEEALNSLKYFCENAPDYHIIAAGSLLGVAVKKKHMKTPVGKVNVLRMFPLTFREFLRAAAPKLYEYVDGLEVVSHLPEIILNKLKVEYKRFMVCGGMPEAASALLDGGGMSSVDKVLQDILDLYELDFAKYADPREITRIRLLWHSLPAQLAKENRKFLYKVIRTGARSKDYEDALEWLKDAGMIYQIYNISKPGMPLTAYQENDAFKIYACDTGLLRRLAKLPADIIASPTSNYVEFKGALAENAALQSLVTIADDMPSYWSSQNKSEVEFVVQVGSEIIPVEVKAEGNISGRSIGVYDEKYTPNYRCRFSMLNLQFNGNLLSCPSPLIDWAFDLLKLVEPKKR
ncbi:MAG: ATP-binding protein [Bacteroidales bacterium]|nr:ATP-binding protein [Bacteroidales bacterium]